MRPSLVLLALLAACGPAANPYLRLEQEAMPAGTLLRIVPAAGVRINAQQPPALEQPDSSILRFTADAVTADSAYYTEPPELVVPGRLHGRIIASICPAGEYVCRPVILTIR